MPRPKKPEAQRAAAVVGVRLTPTDKELVDQLTAPGPDGAPPRWTNGSALLRGLLRREARRRGLLPSAPEDLDDPGDPDGQRQGGATPATGAESSAAAGQLPAPASAGPPSPGAATLPVTLGGGMLPPGALLVVCPPVWPPPLAPPTSPGGVPPAYLAAWPPPSPGSLASPAPGAPPRGEPASCAGSSPAAPPLSAGLGEALSRSALLSADAIEASSKGHKLSESPATTPASLPGGSLGALPQGSEGIPGPTTSAGLPGQGSTGPATAPPVGEARPLPPMPDPVTMLRRFERQLERLPGVLAKDVAEAAGLKPQDVSTFRQGRRIPEGKRARLWAWMNRRGASRGLRSLVEDVAGDDVGPVVFRRRSLCAILKT